MQIGAFARLCETKLSVLRHYDKEGILMPAYVDPITGYRHYSADQAAIFRRITALKQSGFSLAEIRRVLLYTDSDAAVLALFDEQEERLRKMLSDVAAAREMMKEKLKLQVTLTEDGGEYRAISAYLDAARTQSAKRDMDDVLRGERYQRISGYRILRDGKEGKDDKNRTGEKVRLTCRVLRLNDTPESIFEDIALPFADDPSVIGRWDVVGEYVHRDDIPETVAEPFSPSDTSDAENGLHSLYFLPGGAWYWCYGWTKGKVLCRYGDASYVCPYTTEQIGGELFMLVEWKSYEYRCGGRPVILLLRRHDTRAYSAEMLARKDNIDLPFEDDARVIGTWRSVGMVPSPDVFDPMMPERSGLFFSEVTFAPGGGVTSQYGDQTVSGEAMQVWTRGYVLRKWNSTACAYEIRTFDGVDYLLMEWKSGDYIWGGMPSNYYVFRRAYDGQRS